VNILIANGEPVQCPKCSANILHNAEFCHACGLRLIDRCAHGCGTRVYFFEEFCHGCGQKITPVQLQEIKPKGVKSNGKRTAKGRGRSRGTAGKK